jgi:hypothetical protein
VQTFKGRDTIELVLSRSEVGKMAHGYVIHTYNAPHYAQGCEIVAAKLELPTTKGYERLGYRVVETLTHKDIRGNRKRIPRGTPALEYAKKLLAEASASLAPQIGSKRKRT